MGAAVRVGLITNCRGAALPGARDAVLVAVIGALSAACASGTAVPTPAPGTPTATPTPHPGAVVWAVDAAPVTLDAARITTSPAEQQIAAQIYDRLVGYRPGSMELAPGLAANWEADVDGRTYTFNLRPGLTFHDGSALDARAVAWNFDRWMDPENPMHAEFIAWQDHFGATASAEQAEGELPSGLVLRAEAINENTFRITLNAPFSPFVYALAGVPFGIASPSAVTAQGEAYGSDGAHLPVGSGPFRVVHWDADGGVRLAPFAGFRGGPPAAPALQFVVLPEAPVRLAAIAAGTVHGADLPSTFADPAPAGARLIPRPSRTGAWLVLNFSRPPLDDIRVRQAIDLALDRDALLPHFGRFALPASQLLAPGFLGYNDDIVSPDRNLDEARRLFAEADAEGNFKLNIWVANSPRPYLPDPPGTAQAVADQLGELGIDATVRSEALRQFLDDRERGRFTAWIVGWENQTADPDNSWFWHFGAGRLAAEGQYVRPELAEILLTAQRTLGTESREAAYRRAAAMVDADTPRIFLAHTRPIAAIADRLEGYEPGPMGFDALQLVSLATGPTPGPGTVVAATIVVPGAGAATNGAGTPSAAEPATATTATLPPPAETPTATVTGSLADE
jgi:peptide/nickel transport system substrate-binding protein